MLNEEFIDSSKIFKGDFTGKKVQIRGWLHNKRSSGGIQFLLVRDGGGLIQCTLRKDAVNDEVFKKIEKLPIESTIIIDGVVKADSRAPRGFEIVVENIKVFHEAEENYPIAKKYHGPEFLLDNRHLWIRSEKMQAILKVRDSFLNAAIDWFRNNGYTSAHMPILITAACEGGATLFEVKYFDQKAYLTQSWQLYAEAAIASLGKIYTIAPSFRAEKSRTRRHLTEYWHLEVELPWCDLNKLMSIQEELLSFICEKVAKERSYELKLLGRDPKDLMHVKPPFPKITYDEAVEMLKKEGLDFKWGDDFGYEQESRLTSKFNMPFFITYFPKTAKAFYHKLNPERPEVTLSVDLLAPEGYGEITGGGVRIEDYNELLERIKENGLDPKDYQWYLDLRKYGSVPHAGFGMGVERVIAWICKLNHIRDAIAFPRLINRVYP
ncbi:MAG: asparagine--tRNA ligase [Candidatus Bathyarchaeia archaeon]|nr:asparagine--tRNA ligase [Candidatus Bathyarchaeota archaeon]